MTETLVGIKCSERLNRFLNGTIKFKIRKKPCEQSKFILTLKLFGEHLVFFSRAIQGQGARDPIGFGARPYAKNVFRNSSFARTKINPDTIKNY